MSDETETVDKPLHEAIEQYLDWAVVHAFKPGSGTPRTYRIKLNMYAKHFGHEKPVSEITGQEWYRACGEFWAGKSAETYNSGRRAALSFLKFCRDSEPPLSTVQPPKLWKPRQVPSSRSKALPKATVSGMFDPEKYPLRERSLWSILYDSSERLSAVLSLNIPDISRDSPIAKVRIKGGDDREIAWSPYSHKLLWEHIGERTWGPVWLGEIPPWNWRDRPDADKGPPAHNPGLPADTPGHGFLYRLTAHRARIIYRELTGTPRPHRLRHSRLTHLGSSGETGSPMLRAISGHTSDRMLNHYSQPSAEDVAAFMATVGSLMHE